MKVPIFSFILFCSHISKSQYLRIEEEQITLYGSLKHPVEIEVIKNSEKIDFYALNKSWYPYQLEINFSYIINLDGSRSVKQLIYPGRHRVGSLRVIEKDQNHQYSYDIRYSRGNPNVVANASFPYLLPIRSGKRLELIPDSDYFKVQIGDSIFSIRKGIVTALPESTGVDRLFKNSLEILHEDGTIAVYSGFSLKATILLGEKVFPGDAIAISGANAFGVKIFSLNGEGTAKVLAHVYFSKNNETIELSKIDNSIVYHPLHIIEKEMTKREKKRYSDK